MCISHLQWKSFYISLHFCNTNFCVCVRQVASRGFDEDDIMHSNTGMYFGFQMFSSLTLIHPGEADNQ